jgi:hypothetical protein
MNEITRASYPLGVALRETPLLKPAETSAGLRLFAGMHGRESNGRCRRAADVPGWPVSTGQRPIGDIENVRLTTSKQPFACLPGSPDAGRFGHRERSARRC